MDVKAAYDEDLFRKMAFAVQPRHLSLVFDATDQDPQASGPIEVRLHRPDIPAAARLLEQAGARFV